MTDHDLHDPPKEEFPPSFDERLLTPEPPPPPTWSARFSSPLTRLDLILLIGIVVATALTYFLRLGAPDELIPLDEKHYVPDARDVLAFGTESDTRVSADSGAFVVHPPVGKWFIAAGIRLLGDSAAGWRFFGAFVGTMSVVLLYLLARRLWASAWFAALASLLLATEGLWFVQSRVAMLDIYVAFFVLTGVWLLLEDRDRTGIEHRGPRWWRLGAGAAFAFALSTKWSALPFWAAAMLLTSVFEGIRLRERRRVANPVLEQRPGLALLRAGGAITGTFLILPAVIYVSTFTPWFIDGTRYDPPRCVSTAEEPRSLPSRWLCYQYEMLDFHRNLDKYSTTTSDDGTAQADATETATPTATSTPATVTKPTHPYFTEAYAIPWIGRPVAHYYETEGTGSTQKRMEVLGAPNPLTWATAFFIGIPALAWWTFRPMMRRRRGDHAVSTTDPVAPILLLLIVAGYAPLLLADIIARPVFMFYATPMVPFLVLAVVHVLVRATRGGERATVVPIAFAGMAVLIFAYLYPVYAAWPLSPDGFMGWSGRVLYGTQPWRLFGWDLPFPPVDCLAEDVVKRFCWI